MWQRTRRLLPSSWWQSMALHPIHQTSRRALRNRSNRLCASSVSSSWRCYWQWKEQLQPPAVFFFFFFLCHCQGPINNFFVVWSRWSITSSDEKAPAEMQAVFFFCSFCWDFSWCNFFKDLHAFLCFNNNSDDNNNQQIHKLFKGYKYLLSAKHLLGAFHYHLQGKRKCHPAHESLED